MESGGEGARLDIVADELDGGVKQGTGAEDGGDAFGFEEGNVLLGDGAANDDEDILRAALLKELCDAGNDGVVCAGEYAEADAVDVFLNGCVHDHFRGLAEAGVDDFHACIAQGAGDDFCAAVVTVETGLGDENADWGGAGFRRHGEHVRLPQRVSGLAGGIGENPVRLTTIDFTMTSMPVGEEWVGWTVDERFPLLQWLGGGAECGVFLTERPDGSGEKAAIKVIPAGVAEATRRAAGWDAALVLEHPHLLSVLGWGQCLMDGFDAAYAVTEYAPEVLAEILRGRALSVEEARALMEPLLSALEYLHGKGLVHGHVKPGNLLAQGEILKLTADHVLRAGAAGGVFTAGEYDAPELARGVVTPAADVWSVGVTLVEVLTQRRLVTAPDGAIVLPEGVPEPIEEIARACLRLDPANRCGLAEIRARMKGEWVEPVAGETARPVVMDRMVERVADRVELGRPARRGNWWMVAGALLVAVIAVGAFLLWPRVVGRGVTGDGSSESAAAPAAVVPAIVPGVVVRQVPPEVLQSALETIYGTVRVDVRVTVGTGGRVMDGEFADYGPSRYFAKAAMAAAMQWVFRPARVHGRAVRSVWLLKFGFTRGGSEVTATEVSP